MTFFCLAMFLLSSENLSLQLNPSFLHLSLTKKNNIIQLCPSKLIPTMNYCSSLLRSSLSWLKQKKLDLKHSIPLLNNTLLNNQKSQVTNLTMFLHHERFVISLTNLIHTNIILTDPPLTTLTHNLECYDHTPNILPSLNIDSQSITQSSKAIHSTLEYLNIVFPSSNQI